MQERHPARAPKQRGLVISYPALAGVAGAVGALVVAGIVILILWQTNVIFSGSKQAPATSRGVPSIHFRYPKSWTQLPKAKWAAIGAPKNAAAVIQRHGNSANLVVLRAGKAVVNSHTAQKINSQLKAKYSDYRFFSANVILLPNGAAPSIRAMFFTYGRTKQGVLHTIAIIPAKPISFVVETASPPKSKTIAREIGRILKSTTLSYPKK
ncbi:MAG: hypothetical protein ACRDLM_11205 [Gaiellaceae bacterium]